MSVSRSRYGYLHLAPHSSTDMSPANLSADLFAVVENKKAPEPALRVSNKECKGVSSANHHSPRSVF